jgi:hypothetical protein
MTWEVGVRPMRNQFAPPAHMSNRAILRHARRDSDTRVRGPNTAEGRPGHIAVFDLFETDDLSLTSLATLRLEDI